MTPVLLTIIAILLGLYGAKSRQLAVLRRDLQHRLATKKSFLSLVSHELRTPLTSAHLSIQMLERDSRGILKGRQQKLLERAGISMRALVELVESLFEYSRIESSPRLNARLESFSVATVVREVVEQLAVQATDKGLALSFPVDSDPGTIECDKRLLRIIASNLVANAIKFTPAGGEVRVRAERDDPHLLIVVEDTGPGIPSADRARIFEPFEQLDSALSMSRPGLGLGLTLVRDIVAALGGTIRVESAVGRGTTFTVSLPVRPAARGHGPLAVAGEEQETGDADQHANEVITLPTDMLCQPTRWRARDVARERHEA
jgi:signal transduction histidine kinase